MFRSDNLYSEMNYVIENMSPHLVNTLVQCIQMAQQPNADSNLDQIKTLYSIMNSILHIIESILS